MTGPWEDYTSPSDVAAMVTSEAQRQGVDPTLALRVATQESGLRHGAVSPKGAVGVMQLEPGTARDMGVDPTDLAQNIQGGVGYLKKQLDTFGGDHRLAAAAYNAGPGAVQKHGGVPPFAETQKYVAAVAPQAADAPPWMDYAPSAAPAAALKSLPVPGKPIVAQRQPAASPTIAQDALSGFVQPFQTLGHDVMQNFRAKMARGPQVPGSLLDFAKQSVGDIGATGKMLGDVLGLASAPVQAVVKPTARALTNYGPTPYSAPGYALKGGRIAMTDPKPLTGDAAQASNEALINTALSGARPAVGRAPIPKAMTLDELQAAKSAAYQAADAAGVQYTPQAFGKLAGDINSELASAKFNPQLHPNTAAMVSDINTMAAKGHAPTLTELDQLRQVVGRDVSSVKAPGEQMMGGKITGAIDNFIDNAKPGDLISGSATDAADLIDTARDLNTRFRKVQEVTNRTDSAELRASSTYAGGNRANATRQNLRPLIDPKSPQRMRNLTPQEATALNQVVRGTPTQNAMRTIGKVFDPRGLLGASVQTALGIPTHGLSTVTAPIGAAASGLSNGMTAKSVQDLLALMARGGSQPGAAPISILQLAGRPALSLATPAGLVGAGEVAAPLTRIPGDQRRPTRTNRRAGQRGR